MERDDDELSMMSESDQEDLNPAPFPTLFVDRGAPRTWAEVDVERMQNVALNIARSALPAIDNAEPAPHLVPSPTWALDTADPLGLGSVDPRAMALVSGTVPVPSVCSGSRQYV
jgi:hypothetical protein